jgi:S-adenosylmethionine hydrolase
VSTIITLLTDFGMRDAYVAEVKGVLASLATGCTLMDLAHDLAPGDVRAARFVLDRAWRRFPPGTVHLVVVDPDVGTRRRALAAEAEGHFFVAPDNGILAGLPAEARYVELAAPADAAPTFHGRDLFAPAAAQLAIGAALPHLGAAVRDPLRLPMTAPRREGDTWIGTVVHVDRFGTLVSDLGRDLIGPGARIQAGERDVGPLRRTFGDVERGELVAFVGSGGTVEIAVRDGDAARLLELRVGAAVRVTSAAPPTAQGSAPRS